MLVCNYAGLLVWTWLLRIYVLLASASNTRQEQCACALKAQSCGVSLLWNSIGSTESIAPAGEAVNAWQPMPSRLSYMNMLSHD